MIPVTKPYLPDQEIYQQYLAGIWQRNWLTNQGPLVTEIERSIPKAIESVPMAYVTNGTIALQLAIRALQLSGEIITTPYSYVATTSSILWEGCKPVFVDVLSNGNINPNLIEQAITDRTSAIMATHVYGFPCDVKAIEQIAKKHNLKIIYDAAHTFGVKLNGESLYNFGDISTASFHATKLFHTVEGGGVFSADSKVMDKINLLKAFGHIDDEHFCLGINGKQSEFHAAMGLSILPNVNVLIEERKQLHALYVKELSSVLDFVHPYIPEEVVYNYAYMPVLLPKHGMATKFCKKMKENGIGVRRYFYPSLNTLPYLVKGASMPISECIAARCICLPIFNGMTSEEMQKVILAVKACLQ